MPFIMSARRAYIIVRAYVRERRDGKSYGAGCKLYCEVNCWDGNHFFAERISENTGDGRDGWAECSIVFDKRNPWYSWCGTAVWHCAVQNFVSISQKREDLKKGMDI